MKTAIELGHVTVAHDHQVLLRDVTVAIPEGRVVGLLGPSGAGKTTLMRTIVGLQRPRSGSITVLGQPAGAASLRRRIGYVTQAPAVYADLTVEENLRYFGAMVGADRARVSLVVRQVRLEHQTSQLVRSLSGGQRARVSLAVALLGTPDLLVLDEPTVGLDPALRQELWEQFHALAAAGTTLLISSHVMDEARRCDQLVLMREGQLLASETPAGLMKRTKTNDIEAAFLKLVEVAV